MAGTPRRSLPFPQTTRWLRGRLVASLTNASPGAWIPPPSQLGDHAHSRRSAARGLEREGFDAADRLRPGAAVGRVLTGPARPAV